MAKYKGAMDRLSRYSLEDLANETGLSPRTIRHYIAQGLLPGPESLGRNAWYSEDHLDRLKCIQILKDRTGAALADLRPIINSLPEEQIRDIAAGREQVMSVPVGSGSHPGQRAAADEPMAASSPPLFSRSAPPSDRVESADALSYIRSIRAGQLDDASRLAEVVRALERIAGRGVPRRAKNDWWATVSITPDIEIRARGLDEQDIGELERLADLLRHLLMKGVEK